MEVDAQATRWAQDGSPVVWCDSAEGILQSVAAGSVDVEVGAADASILEAIARVAQQLRSLSLTGCGFDSAALVQLGVLLATTRIEGVGVSNNPGIDVACWAEFWHKLPVTVLKYDFGDNELPDAALAPLMAAASRGRVCELFLDGNSLTDISPLLPLVSESADLVELDIGDNSFGDIQMAQLAEALPSSALTTLVLGRNFITDAGAVPIIKALPRAKLSILHLDSTQITDTTIDALLSVLAGCPLEELHLDETKITDDGVMRLCRALPTSRISILDVSDNNLSDATMSAVEQAFPQDDML